MKKIYTIIAFAFLLLQMSGEVQAQKVFASAVSNPFDITDSGSYAIPTFVDIDYDDDYDLFVGNEAGEFLFFRNIGTASVPQFDTIVTNPFNLSALSGYSSPDFFDIDNDGDKDMISGNGAGEFYYFENTGTASVPDFADAVKDTFDLFPLVATTYSVPRFVYFNNDDIIDIVSGGYNGDLYYFKNTGDSTSPSFLSAVTNPSGITGVGTKSSPTFIDWDLDGDKDILVGKLNGNTACLQNIGTASSPDYIIAGTNLLGIHDAGDCASPCLVDIDNDGDDDLFFGGYNGNIRFQENCVTSSAIVVSVCDSSGRYISPSGKYTWTESGIYKDTLVNTAGCDSIVTIDLSVGNKTMSTIDVPLCLNASYFSPSGKKLTVSGVYTDTILNTTGCDSIITINLYNDSTLDCGLEAYYSFDNDVLDHSGNGNNGISTEVTFTESHCQDPLGAASFDSSNNPSYVNIGNSIKPERLPVAISFWMNIPDTTSNSFIFRNDRFKSGVKYAGFGARINNSSIIAYYGDNGGSGKKHRRTYVSDSGVLRQDEWQYITVNIRGKSDFEIYVDTVLVNGTYSGSANTMGCSGSQNGFIGIGMDEYPFTGQLDEFKIYSRGLNTSEIRALFNDGCITSINEVNDNQNINLNFYPNPATDNINFETEIEMVRIYNLYGGLELEEQNVSEISVQTLCNGIYTAIIHQDNSVFSRKLIINY